MHQGRKHHHDLKKLLPTLDIGSHSNATRQARLEAVACTPMLGQARRERNGVYTLYQNTPVPVGFSHRKQGASWWLYIPIEAMHVNVSLLPVHTRKQPN